MDKKYLRIYNGIKNEIISGGFSNGQKLPSKRTIAEKEDVSLITVEHAYDILKSEGYIESCERSGFYVTYNEGEMYYTGGRAETEVKGKEIRSAESDERFPFSVYERIVRSVINDYGEKILDKSPNSGIEELKTAIRKYLMRNRDITVENEQIIIGSGAEHLYGMIIELLGRNLIYGIEEPSYEQIENVYSAQGVKYEKLTLSSEGIRTSDLRKSVASVLHVTPYRSYPTGVTATVSKKKEYLRWANERNGYLIEDDYESEFSVLKKNEETLFGEDESERVIYVNTFSKTISPSLRTGYMLLPKRLVKDFYIRLGFYSCTVPMLEQYIIADLLNDGSFERHLNRIRRERRKKL